ncbi:DUF1773 family protein [Schizosaccharomyces pombe]|uniref:UPF0612 protein P20C8.01c n=1 Tax=Schizosaccharomyces pombe (strain 972 / ATCC 24843) TaxID=284812 RepID=YJ51_SCHPO|nr:uncharacterized protein SPCP20C8.01c [Schizosaccharomyces pombe]Q9HDT8.1 RecName: Full=UPF0612 protein P20C8.01c [Schizosaccharomyces pombe 972h-]CAC22108.1 cell surface glycoprotein (predicted), DUF2429 family [Schizosaccharomyces pombe]|eukprot:NP_587673.1 uncharacterized protein SPCP20C8.01c [Schizosaccharomyces pombe]
MMSNENFDNDYNLPPPNDSAEDLKIFIKRYERSVDSTLLEIDENKREALEKYIEERDRKMKYEIECNERLQGWKKLAIEREISEEQSGEVQFPRWIDEWANTKLGGIFERIFSKMDSMQNDMNSRFDAMQNEMNSRFDTVQNEMTSMKGEMAEMKVEMVEMKRETIRLNTRIDLLEQKTEARFQSIEQRFNSIDQRFNSIDRRFDSMEQRLDSMDQKMETIDARSCRSIMLTRKLENTTRSDQGYLA